MQACSHDSPGAGSCGPRNCRIIGVEFDSESTAGSICAAASVELELRTALGPAPLLGRRPQKFKRVVLCLFVARFSLCDKISRERRVNKMPNYIKAILVFAERHAANLERQFPTLTKIGYGAGGGVLATGTTGAVKWAFTHPQNHQELSPPLSSTLRTTDMTIPPCKLKREP